MINQAKAEAMSLPQLLYARKDLFEVIEIQQLSNLLYPGSCEKLKQYQEEFNVVFEEIKRRTQS